METKNMQNQAFVDLVRSTFEKLKEDEKRTLFLCSILCVERWIPQRILMEIIAPQDPQKLQDTIDGLYLGNWLDIRCSRVSVCTAVATGVYRCYFTSINEIDSILCRLRELTTLHPDTSLKDVKPYFQASFSLLSYILQAPLSDIDWELYAHVASNIAVFGGVLTRDETTPRTASSVEDNPVFAMLYKATVRARLDSVARVRANIQMASFYANTFHYPDADWYINVAEEILRGHEECTATVELTLVRSQIAQNKGLHAQSIIYQKRAYDINERLFGAHCEQNIELAFRMSILCMDAVHTQANWHKRAHRMMDGCGKSFANASFIGIISLMADAALYRKFGDFPLIQDLLDRAELAARQIFGPLSAVEGEICALRCILFDRLGLFEEGLEDYSRYVDCTQYTYGTTTGGDLAELSVVECFAANNKNRSKNTALRLCEMMRMQYDEKLPAFAPGVRADYCLCVATVFSDVDDKVVDEYVSQGIKIIETELMPSEETIEELSGILSKQEGIPSSLLYYDLLRLFYTMRIEQALSLGQYEKAEERYKMAVWKLSVSLAESCRLAIMAGCIEARKGEYEEAEKVWDSILNNAPQGEYSKLADEIAHTALSLDQLTLAKKYFDLTEQF